MRRREHILVCDSKGVIWQGRDEKMDETKARYARDTPHRTVGDAMDGIDIFLGLSGPGAVNQEMIKRMGRQPLILALANPDPEITPPDAHAIRPDAIVCTGRSDYPNQVNNVPVLSFIFRGALDVGATTINEEMKQAAVHAIADLAHAEQSDIVAEAYADESLHFGPDYLIPKPFDPRLIIKIAPAVAKAAWKPAWPPAPLPTCPIT